ncbi:hypothetical protein GCK32_016786 [Trichostrongylus colubriformis]|uniref:Uncharacterized protein n=1 Tax=Trichostrongylus colubriformis TaxID=6319 RepID=A0AAN8IBZ4_TRICO
MSAATFVEQARLNGCTTPITMITQEDFLPYDRTHLSKNPAATGREIELRDGEYYRDNQIDILTNTHVRTYSFGFCHMKLNEIDSVVRVPFRYATPLSAAH